MKKTLIIALLLTTFLGCQQKETATVKQDTANQETKKEVKTEPSPKACTKDAKMCPDGRSVGRNPLNNCEFHPCESAAERKKKIKKEVMCTADVKECPDGSWVGRDHSNNCQFKPCPDAAKKENNGRDTH